MQVSEILSIAESRKTIAANWAFLGVVKRSGRDEPVWVVRHTCTEATLGISLYSYFISN
jgi:hypothetical protein